MYPNGVILASEPMFEGKWHSLPENSLITIGKKPWKSISNLSAKEAISQALIKCRKQTLALFTDINEYVFTQQSHPDFSPIGWHLGHIAFTEAYWILEYIAGYPALFPEYHKLFAADGLPKVERQNLPNFTVIKDYFRYSKKQGFKLFRICSY